MARERRQTLRGRAGRIGVSLCGRYRIVREIGAGGMATVYAGKHRNGHEVAIKVLHERLSNDPAVERSFRREALLANTIAHPGVVPIIDDDVTDDGCIFLVMPLLEGETLRARAARLGGLLPIEEVFVVADALLGTLEAAHAKRIVHRDVKPENLFLTRTGELRVLDFGIARFFDSGAAMTTRSGRAVGTPAFMAPEQALSRSRDVDGRTDLWAVGATMFTLLAGRVVHQAESASETLVAAATQPAPALAQVAAHVPGAVCAVVDRALAFAREERFSDAASMRAALSHACEEALGLQVSQLPALTCAVAIDAIHGSPTEPPLAGDSAESTAETSSPPDPLRVAVTRTLPIAALRPRFTKRLALGAGALAAVSLVVGVAMKGRALRSTPTGAPSGAPAAEVAKLLAASRAEWLSGDVERARADAKQALALDDSSASAHLAIARAAPFWFDDESRTHFIRAHERQDALTPDERAYADALAPAMVLPADFGESAKRFEVLHGKATDDIDVAVAFADMKFRLNRTHDAVAILAPFAAKPDAPGIVLAEFAEMQGADDDVDGARATLARCIASYPEATRCMWGLSYLELLEGRCSEAERATRRELGVNPKARGAYLRLAYALDGEGVSTREIRPLLKKWAELDEPAMQEIDELRGEQKIALIEGRFNDALTIDGKLGELVSKANDDPTRFHYTRESMLLKSELGMTAAASRVLDAYTSTRQELHRDVYGGDNVMYLNSVAARLGVIPWSTWLELRDVRLKTHLDRDDLLDGPQRTWLEYFAYPATTPEHAKEALAAFDRYAPLLHNTERWYWDDAAMGEVLSLTGRAADAQQYFDRASAACTRLYDPITFVHGMVMKARALESLGRREDACSVYDRILAQWPARTASVSSAFASSRRKETCPAFNTASLSQ